MSQELSTPSCCDRDWVTTKFKASDYTASGGIWIVDSLDVTVNRYQIIGKTMHWILELKNTTTSLLPFSLDFKVPDGYKCVKGFYTVGRWYNNMNVELILVNTSTGRDIMHFLRVSVTGFDNGINTHDFSFGITFEIE